MSPGLKKKTEFIEYKRNTVDELLTCFVSNTSSSRSGSELIHFIISLFFPVLTLIILLTFRLHNFVSIEMVTGLLVILVNNRIQFVIFRMLMPCTLLQSF